MVMEIILKDSVCFEKAAEMLGVQPKTLRNKLAMGVGPRNFKYMGRVYFKLKDLEAFMRRNVVYRAG